MGRDFYVEEKGAAAYFEREWADLIVASGAEFGFAYPRFEPQRIACDHSARVMELLARGLHAAGARPARVLEVGASVGRGAYELVRAVPSVEHLVMLEPSENLRKLCHGVLTNTGARRYPVLRGAGLGQVEFDSEQVARAMAHVNWELRGDSFEQAGDVDPPPDLVICMNVIDQVRDPWALVSFLWRAVPPGGFLLISCTYLWRTRYLSARMPPPSNLRDAFLLGWELIEEGEVMFHGRERERAWRSYLSHTLLLRRAV